MIDKPPEIPSPTGAAPEATSLANTPTPLDPATFSSAHNALLSDSSIQFELTMQPPPEPLPPPDPSAPPSRDWLGDFFAADHPWLRVSLWVLAALFALAIVALIVMRLRGMEWPWRRAAEADADGDWRPEAGLARTLLGQADALAAAGRYSEAAHLLLYRSIEDVDERRPDLIRKSLTSRDIAALPAIPARPRGAFARIAMLVERGIFARRELAEPDWRECRTAYEEFAFVEGWR
jgi:hypothetical protein